MPKQRQRTLFEFVSNSSSPLKHSSPPKGNPPPIEIESDDDDSDPGRIKFEQEASENSDGDHTGMEEDRNTAAPRRSARLLVTRKGTSPSVSPSSTSSEREVLPRNSNRSGRNKRLVVTSDESGDQKTVKRRRLVKGKRPDSLSDVDHDENLVDEVDEDKILASRLRGRPKKTDFVRNLERLQRRRRGETSDSPNEDSEDSDSGLLSDSPPATSDQVFEGAHPTVNEEEDDTADDGTLLNADHDDFIVEDADDEEIPELPTLFSMGTFQDLSHHFKVICQFFVHLAIQMPHKRRSFIEQEMKKNYFSVPLAIARRKLSAMKDSLVTSSIWKPDFKKPLELSPEFRLESLEFSIPRCDACHIGNRIATLRGVSGRRKYDRTTFELLEEENATESDQESHEIEWNLGRFCAARAQVFHLFSHWEYILFHSLREEVERLQEALSPGKKARVFLPATKGPPPPDDPSDADGIMDWLDGRGIINSQWVKVKSMMDRARKLEVGREAGEDLEIV